MSYFFVRIDKKIGMMYNDICEICSEQPNIIFDMEKGKEDNMRKFWKRAGSVGIAAALLAGILQVAPTSFVSMAADEPLFSSECEDLTLSSDATVATKVYNDEYPGYTGEGFVWVTSAGTMSFTIDAPETGMYRLMTRCLVYLGNVGETRQATVSVTRSDDSTWSKDVKIAHTESWNDYSWGDIKLTKGENTITFGGGWGYCLYDNMTLSKTPKPEYDKATDVLTDAKATSQTQALMTYLKSVYGSHIISGQQEIYGGGHDNNMELEFDYIKNTTGKLPAIRGFDFMNYNPLYGWEDGTTERAIEWAKDRNGIVTASWHINVPIDFDKYELGDEVDWQKCTYKNYQVSNSTFNTANAVKEGTKEYEYFQECMKDLAEQLTKLQDAGVPIILRPLHEAQGNEGNYSDGTAWFWWGDRGAEVYKELWKLLYNTLTEKYNLHNIIWEYNSYNYANSDTWYPGDDYVDIVAYDKYNCEYNRDDGLSFGTPNLSAISSVFNYLYELTDGKKMVAMAENDSIPSVENMTIENAGWLYFCPWYGDHLMSSTYNDPDELKVTYNSDYCITLDELPKNLYGSATPGTTTETKETTTAEETTTTEATETTDDTTVTSAETTTASTDESSKTTETTVTTSDSTKSTEETTVSSDTTTTSFEKTTTVSTDESTEPSADLYGDVNLDGDVDLSDAVLMNKAIAGQVSLNAAAKANADCQKDGIVSSDDSMTLLKFLVHLVNSLPQ